MKVPTASKRDITSLHLTRFTVQFRSTASSGRCPSRRPSRGEFNPKEIQISRPDQGISLRDGTISGHFHPYQHKFAAAEYRAKMSQRFESWR